MNKPVAVMRFWAAIDLLVTGLLALPLTALWFIATLYQVNGWFGGSTLPPSFDPVHLLFVCLMGGLGVLWALVRLCQPVIFLGRADGLARLWVSGLIAYFVFVEAAPLALVLFIVTELLGAVHQLWALRGHDAQSMQ
jgi:hypothetical protein